MYKDYTLNLLKELDGLDNRIESEEKFLELCFLINEFVNRFPILIYHFLDCSVTYMLKKMEKQLLNYLLLVCIL